MGHRSTANLLNVLGFASIIGSIAIWMIEGGQQQDEDKKAHGERFGIFVGLWAPTFFALANRFHTAAQAEES